MRELVSRIPSVEVLLALQAEELAGELLALLQQRYGPHSKEPRKQFHPQNSRNELWPRAGQSYPVERQGEVDLAYVEAWQWLVTHGLVVGQPGSEREGWQTLSRKGRELSPQQFADFRTASRFPKELIHPRIADEVWLAFIRGDYGTAVFQAMRAVEVAVRRGGNFSDRDYGVVLMRKAFNKDNGPLTDLDTPEGEREALMSLFAGAIGSYKNPHSHRHVPLNSPAEAIEIILLATHLLRIAESREPAPEQV